MSKLLRDCLVVEFTPANRFLPCRSISASLDAVDGGPGLPDGVEHGHAQLGHDSAQLLVRPLQRRRGCVAVRLRTEVEVRDGEAVICGPAHGLHGVQRGGVDGFPGPVVSTAGPIVVQRLRVPAFLENIQFSAHISQNGKPRRQIGDLRTQCPHLGLQRQVRGFGLLAHSIEFRATHLGAVIDDGQQRIGFPGQIEELLLAVDAHRKPLADIALLGNAMAILKARDRRGLALIVPRQHKTLAVLAIVDLHHAVGRQQAFVVAVDGHPHSFVERRPQRGFAARAEFAITAKGFAA